MTRINPTRRMAWRLGAAVLGAVTLFASPTAAEADVGAVNLYSYRQEFLIRPLLDEFSKRTGIRVNVQYVEGGVLRRMQEEGENSPADAVLTVDIARLKAHADAGTLQPVESGVLERNIPPQYRHPDGLWFGLTTRSRVIVYSKDRVDPTEIARYEDLTDPKWKGRVCTRSSSNVYMKSLLASIIAANGEDAALNWANGVKENLARKPQGNDRAQVKAIWQGECDLALINTYYIGAMRHNEKEPEQKEWAESIGVIFPNQADRGAHVNISAAGVARYAKNKANAVRLIEFLSEDWAQKFYAAENFEYPVKPGVEWSPEVMSWGQFKPDDVNLATVADYVPLAVRLYDRAGYQ